jgi:hypothetical protein
MRDGILHAKSAGIPNETVDKFSQELGRASAALWRTINRLSAVGKQNFRSEIVLQRLKIEHDKLEQLAAGVREAHEGLLLLTMSDFGAQDIQTAEYALRGLREMAEVLDS